MKTIKTNNMLRELIEGNLVVIAINNEEEKTMTNFLIQYEINCCETVRAFSWSDDFAYVVYGKGIGRNEISKLAIIDPALEHINVHLSSTNMVRNRSLMFFEDFYREIQETEKKLAMNTIVKIIVPGFVYPEKLYKIDEVEDIYHSTTNDLRFKHYHAIRLDLENNKIGEEYSGYLEDFEPWEP